MIAEVFKVAYTLLFFHGHVLDVVERAAAFDVILVSLLLTLNRFHTLFLCFYS